MGYERFVCILIDWRTHIKKVPLRIGLNITLIYAAGNSFSHYILLFYFNIISYCDAELPFEDFQGLSSKNYCSISFQWSSTVFRCNSAS